MNCNFYKFKKDCLHCNKKLETLDWDWRWCDFVFLGRLYLHHLFCGRNQQWIGWNPRKLFRIRGGLGSGDGFHSCWNELMIFAMSTITGIALWKIVTKTRLEYRLGQANFQFQFCHEIATVGKQHTVWKFHDFCINHILREINFEDTWSAKSAILPQSEALNFDWNEFLHFLKSEIYQINIIQSPKNGKNVNFSTSTFSKTDFTKNLNDMYVEKSWNFHTVDP